LSHLHWDHIQGIPFFRPAYDPKSTLRLYGPVQHRPLRELLGLGMDDPFFPVDLDGLPVQLEVHEVESGSRRGVGPYQVSGTRPLTASVSRPSGSPTRGVAGSK